MMDVRSNCLVLIFAVVGIAGSYVTPDAQAPVAPAAGAQAQGGGGRGGRGGLPGATPEQTQAVADMNTALAALSMAVTTARTELATATFAEVKNAAAVTAAVEQVRAAELALAMGRATEFAKLQAGPNKLNQDQVTALIAAGGNPAAGRGGRGGGAPGTAPPAGAQMPAPVGRDN